MPKEVKGIVLSRLIVVISIILIPIITFFIFYLVDFGLWYTSNATLNFLVIKILCPIVFSVSWLFFLILFAKRVAASIDNMDNLTGVIPLRLKIFYGIIAGFLALIWFIPLATPIVSILSFSSMAWRLTTHGKESWDDPKVSNLTKFTMVLFSIIPIFCFISILPDYMILAQFLFEQIWTPMVNFIYILSYTLCTALGIGSFIVLITNQGVAEYEQIFEDNTESKTLLGIKLFELILFVFLFLLAWYGFEIVDLFYYIGFGIVVLVFIVNFVNGKRRDRSFRSYFLGYILAVIFIGSSLIFSYFEIEFFETLGILSLISSGFLFAIAFIYTFLKLEESEL